MTRCRIVRYIAQTPSDLVGVAGFEPTAPRSQSECATKLRHTPCTEYCSLREHPDPALATTQDLPKRAAGTLGRAPVRAEHAGVAQW